jgi:two-component system response regulator QseB
VAGQAEFAGAAPAVLLVEDDRELAALLARLLADEGYAVDHAPDGQRGLHLALTGRYDVLVVDRGLPAVEGLDLLGRLRRRGVSTPTLVLSARGTARDRVEGLDAGAEDYLAKPFDVDELLARLRALRRRTGGGATGGGQVLPLGARVLDVQARCVHPPGEPGDAVQLSARETALLRTLATRPAQVFSRADLLAYVFTDADSDAVVDTYVHYCRRKLGNGVILTVRGVGYRLGRA